MKTKKNYIAALLLLSTVSPTKTFADAIGIKTAAATSETITVAINPVSEASIVWKDGTVESLIGDGTPQTVVVKADSFAISTKSPVKYLYVPQSKITSLDLTDVPDLEYLFCQNNLLTKILLTKVTGIKELNCANNLLETLSVRSSVNLKWLNCAGNNIETISFSNIKDVETLICADNKISELVLSKLTNLKQLWCQNNQITKLTLSNQTNLKGLYCFSNDLSAIEMGSKPELTDIWAEDNAISTLDLQTSAKLVSVSINDNQLNDVSLNSSNKNSLKYYYCHNNSLFFNSFPTIYNRSTGKYTVTAVIDPQEPYKMIENCEFNTSVDLTDFTKTNGWGDGIMLPIVAFKTSDNAALSSTTDYNWVRNKVTFNNAFPAVYLETSNSNYPGITLRTASFWVYDPNALGIEGSTTTPDLPLTASKGSLHISNSTPRDIKICSLSGICIKEAKLAAGSHTFTLPSGIYIVNKKKIVIP